MQTQTLRALGATLFQLIASRFVTIIVTTTWLTGELAAILTSTATVTALSAATVAQRSSGEAMLVTDATRLSHHAQWLLLITITVLLFLQHLTVARESVSS